MWVGSPCITKLALFLKGGDSKRFRLFTGQYEGLASMHDYYDEEADDHMLPTEIDGKPVFGVNDESVVGGELGWCDDSESVEFDGLNDPSLNYWLSKSQWLDRVPACLDRIKEGLAILGKG